MRGQYPAKNWGHFARNLQLAVEYCFGELGL